MGVYVNPKDMEKEEWLSKNASIASLSEFLKSNFDEMEKQGKRFVILLDNYAFTAASVCFSSSELDYFKNLFKTEDRPYKIYTASIDLLKEVSQ